jgi:tetratricopeptide (TPR) repeat protein
MPTEDAPAVATRTPPERDLPSIDGARALIASGDPEGALVAARRALADRPDDTGYRLVEADALRALRRFGEAVVAYDRVAASHSAARAGAGFRAASIRFRNMADPSGAIASLDAAAVDAEGAAFEERGLALRARSLAALGRGEEAREVALRYLARFPTGTTRSDMLRLTTPD